MVIRRLNFFKENGLSLAMFFLFAAFITGQVVTGRLEYNDDLARHDQPAIGFSEYLQSGHFFEATFENWESEFFQMGLYVILTAFLYQRGSSESKKLPDEANTPRQLEIERLRAEEKKELIGRYGSPSWTGKRLNLYRNSLSVALGVLFIVSWILHAWGGWKNENVERSLFGQPAQGFWDFVRSSEFWFQSFQNWQSEFVSVGLLIVLTIFLRQEGSAQSKDVDAPHCMTGD